MWTPPGEVGPRPEGGRHRNISGQDSAREIQIFKKISAENKNDKGDLYLVTAASRPRAVLSSANLAKPTARGRRSGVPVARGGLVLARGGGTFS